MHTCVIQSVCRCVVGWDRYRDSYRDRGWDIDRDRTCWVLEPGFRDHHKLQSDLS